MPDPSDPNIPKLPDSVLRTPFKPALFANKVAIVTGGGTGIGRAIVLELLELGARVAICGRRQEPLDAVVTECRERGHEIFAETCDIRDAERVNAFVDHVLAKFGAIDILVNNAGGQFPSPAQMISPKGFEAVVRNNLVGTFNMTHAVGNKAMIPSRRGKIVNIIANIFRGFPGMAHTGAARAGVDNLTKSLAVEWAPFDIQVNAIAPGIIVSTGTDRYPPELVVKAKHQTPAKRLGVPEEVAHMVSYLACDAAAYVTGTTIYIDGGASLWGDIWDVVTPD